MRAAIPSVEEGYELYVKEYLLRIVYPYQLPCDFRFIIEHQDATISNVK